MASVENRKKRLLKVARDGERSRREGQLLAAAYEQVTPLVRRTLAAAPADRFTRPRTRGAEQPQPRTGGNCA